MIAIIGGGYAGRMAAARLRTAGAEVTLVDARADAVERTRLHEAAATGRSVALPLAPWLPSIGARFVHGRVVRIEDGGLTLDDGRDVPFQGLVVAAGSVPVARPCPGVFTLEGPEEAAEMRARLRDRPDGSGVAVVGAGLTGIELAAELAEGFPQLRVHLVGAPVGFSARGEAILGETLAKLGVRWVHAQAVGVDPEGVDLADGTRVEAAVTAWTTGLRAPGWLADAGLPVDASGRIRVTPSLSVVGRPEIVAAGDCAASGLRMACATAMPTGCHAADTLLRTLRGEDPRPLRFAYAVRCVSLGRRAGLVQGVDAEDRPTWALGGRPAAAVKEAILQVAARVHGWESASGVPLYGWPRGRAGAPQEVFE